MSAVPLAARFPPGFLFGAATAAYQIEGAWDADGKGESIWDAFCRVPGAIANGDTGDVACDHYRRDREDLELAAELGLGAYRFSVSWPRVLPQGAGAPNERGLAFYDRLVDGLLERGIRPVVTLYHWDLPQALQLRGGWGNPDVAGWFGEYAALVAGRLGDRVSDWITLNEPWVVAFPGHASGEHAPGLRDWPLALRVAHHLLLAHRAGAEALRTERPGCKVGIALNLAPCHPAGGDPEDAAAAARLDGHLNRWFLDPLFGRGYPGDLVEWYGRMLPERAPEELRGDDGGLDFLGVNYYSRAVVRASAEGELRLERVVPRGAETTEMGWEVYPDGLRELLLRVQADYAPRRLLVTENGAALPDEPNADGKVEDAHRTRFLAAHLEAVADALAAGAPLGGYFAWSLLDNFEWQHGYSKRFGLVYVDYATQRRTIKASGSWYRELIAAAGKPAPAPGR
jgi:beta-glucosidase